ncbi:hypothetical protein LCGC14_0879000 [marine sediment metagenome]|uniref:DUF3800 domain-containing protein n=1 Tax=marine sediment metagenome TaxID=412755 RepID=A0A0F9PN52_9ZZZZ
MYLAFIDESGTIQENDPQSNYYVLTAMVMQEKGMKFLHRETQELKREIWRLVHGPKNVMPRNFEIHMKDILNAKNKYKPLRGNKQKTEEILRNTYNFISKLYITIISIVIVKKDFYAKYQKNEFLPWALRLIIERINGHISIETLNDEDKEYALLLMDEDFSTDNEKRDFISEMMEEGIKYKIGVVDKVLDTPIFLKSELHNDIQLVDSIAYLIGRYIRKVLDGHGSTLFDDLSDYFLLSLVSRFYGGVPSKNLSKGIKFFPSYAPSKFFNVFKDI